jgi:hypothetical protein
MMLRVLWTTYKKICIRRMTKLFAIPVPVFERTEFYAGVVGGGHS